MTLLQHILRLVLVVGFVSTVQAQSATEFFHSGAKAYVDEELNEALSLVESGLELEPDNARLIALQDKIKEEQENQEQQQGNSNEQSNGNQEDQQQQESEQDQESEQEEDDQQQEQQDEQKPGEDQQEDNQQQEQQNRPDQNQPPDTNQLSKEQAERILQALENEEEKLLREVQKIKGRPRRVEKDW